MQAKRSLLCRYLKIDGSWVLIGSGFTENTTSYNPDSEDTQYINEDSKRTELKSYAPTMSLSGVIEMTGSDYPYTLNPIFAYLNEMRRTRKVGNSGEILEIELYTCTAFDKSSTPNKFKNCKSSRNKVNFQFDDFGGDAGNSISFTATINYDGEPLDTDALYDVEDTPNRTPTLVSSSTKTITYTLEHVDKVMARTNTDTSNGIYVTPNETLTAQFVAKSGYNLPSAGANVSVKNGSATLTVSTDYTWDSTSGVLYIKPNKITDNVTVSITGTA